MKRYILYGAIWILTLFVIFFHPGYRWTFEKHLWSTIDFAIDFPNWSEDMKYRNKYGKMFNPIFRAKFLLPVNEAVTIDPSVLMNKGQLQFEAFWLYHMWPHPVRFERKETSSGYVLMQENDSTFLKLMP